MYIISKYKDYYDGVAGTTGIDKECKYIRIRKYIKDTPSGVRMDYNWMSETYLLTHGYRSYDTPKGTPDRYDYFSIGFCGKLYIGYEFIWDKEHEFDKEKRFITYDPDKILELILKTKSSDPKKRESVTRKFKNAWSVLNGSSTLKFHIKHKAPVFVYDPECKINDRNTPTRIGENEWKKTQLNPILKHYEFAKAVDPVTAFQELSMFIGGVLVNVENNMVEIDKKYRLQQRGMDETSFRQVAPGDKKEKRRANKARKKNQKA